MVLMRSIGAAAAVFVASCSLLAGCSASVNDSASTLPTGRDSATTKTVPTPTTTTTDEREALPRVTADDIVAIPTIEQLPRATAESMVVEALVAPPLFGPEYRSIYLSEKTHIYTIPELDDAFLLGRLPPRAHVVPVESLSNSECKYEWLRIRPMGWICSPYTLSTEQPTTDVFPNLYKPGFDGRVYKDEADVLADGGRIPESPPSFLRKNPIQIKGRTFYETREGELIEASNVEKFWGSPFEGVFMNVEGAPKLPIAWTWNDSSHTRPTKVYAERDTDSEVKRELSLRSVVEVLDEVKDWVQVEDGWIRKKDLRIAYQATDKPDGVATDDETWVSIELDEQTLIAYRGTQPIFATLISGGRWKFPTPKGTFRITKKTALTSMVAPKWSTEQYAVGNVPWVAHISELYALHGAWWHYAFGIRMSHGCVNLSTTDAREVYNLLDPQVPDGWWEKYATDNDPGSVVYIYKRSTEKHDKEKDKKKKDKKKKEQEAAREEVASASE